MIKDIHALSLVDILPDSILRDEQVYAAAKALDEELQNVTAATIEALHLPRLDVLPESVVDLLAWQWHVDFYEPVGLDIETKRNLVKKSIEWHRTKGTPYAVEQVVSTVFSNASLKEWFEYGGEPYHFSITARGFDPTKSKDFKLFLRVLETVKNTRSWLEAVTLDVSPVKKDGTSDELELFYGLADMHQGRKTIELPQPPDATVHPYNGVAYFRMGRERIGAGTEPPPSPISYFEGSFFMRVGRVTLPFDASDIGSTYVNRLYPAGGDYRLGSVLVRLGKKTITIATPLSPTAKSYTGIAESRGGRMRIGAGSVPSDTEGTYKAGLFGVRVGRVTIPHDPADVHDTHDHTLYPFESTSHTGIIGTRFGRKRVGAGSLPPTPCPVTQTGLMAIRAGRVTIPHDPSEVTGNYDVPLYPADVGYAAGMASYA